MLMLNALLIYFPIAHSQALQEHETNDILKVRSLLCSLLSASCLSATLTFKQMDANKAGSAPCRS